MVTELAFNKSKLEIGTESFHKRRYVKFQRLSWNSKIYWCCNLSLPFGHNLFNINWVHIHLICHWFNCWRSRSEMAEHMLVIHCIVCVCHITELCMIRAYRDHKHNSRLYGRRRHKSSNSNNNSRSILLNPEIMVILHGFIPCLYCKWQAVVASN